MKDFQKEVGIWGVKTFDHDGGKRNIQAIISHIRKEIDELAMHETVNEAREECADILILMCSIAYLLDFDLLEEAKMKMKINYRRLWAEPDENGVIEHVRE